MFTGIYLSWSLPNPGYKNIIPGFTAREFTNIILGETRPDPDYKNIIMVGLSAEIYYVILGETEYAKTLSPTFVHEKLQT